MGFALYRILVPVLATILILRVVVLPGTARTWRERFVESPLAHPSVMLRRPLLEQAGVAVLSGTAFGALGEGYLRFSYANSQDNIRKALTRFAEFVATVRNGG